MADCPCAVLARFHGGKWKLSVADPAQKSARIRVGFLGREMVVEMPGGMNAGQSVTQETS